MSNAAVVTATSTSSAPKPGRSTSAASVADTAACRTATPFGRPVEPEVYIR